MRETLPKFFDFESVGILLKDQQTEELFTFVETMDSKVMKNDKEQRDNYNGINPKNDVVTMKIPTKLGVTGHVYKTEEIYVCQNALKDQKFNNDVDNLGGGTKSVNNFIIGAIYGFPPELGKPKKTIGIL